MIMFSKTNKAYQKIMVSLFSIMFLHSTLFFYALFVLFIIIHFYQAPGQKKRRHEQLPCGDPAHLGN